VGVREQSVGRYDYKRTRKKALADKRDEVKKREQKE
jgi:hypothetical protein